MSELFLTPVAPNALHNDGNKEKSRIKTGLCAFLSYHLVGHKCSMVLFLECIHGGFVLFLPFTLRLLMVLHTVLAHLG